VAPVSEIKLIRTDTTLDLSQKAEKVWLRFANPSPEVATNVGFTLVGWFAENLANQKKGGDKRVRLTNTCGDKGCVKAKLKSSDRVT
jgi:hypothetical protein